jgi:hypothetical protein
MAIDLGYSKSMYNLGYYYEHTEKNYDLMKKYYLMAINLKCKSSFNNYESYCITNNLDFELFKLRMKHQRMTSRKNIINIINTISSKNKTYKEENFS